jgi:hypothetical protein
VTNLVDSFLLLARQVASLIDDTLFKKVANFVARRKEVVVTDVVVVTRGEFGLYMTKLVR